MKRILYYYLRSYFGFSTRESRGFVLVIPSLILLYMLPSVYEWGIRYKNQGLLEQYELILDSIIQAEMLPKEIKAEHSDMDQDSIKRTGRTNYGRNPGFNRIDFNEADSVVLQIVPGIGQTMASRIVKFRENIGGLHQKEQLLDVYGMTPEIVEKLFDHFLFSPAITRKLDINDLDIQELAKHPYISYGAAKVIVAYREQHGPYKRAEDLLQIKIFNQDWVDRLLPYLEFGK
ncbi:ComEA family DNA-binding protein [Cecembia rubra]|uniref:ComEA family DNA-binding protein n=1 Tax=Cecembia rubra TaxID=1485585 RepID=UPI0027154756|nr:helix-hairpin-helix domain-containing protein [Cecembia rubra]